MQSDVVLGLFIAVMVGIVAQSGAMWFKLGSLERAIKKSCPFGDCPIFNRAKQEAAPEREEVQK